MSGTCDVACMPSAPKAPVKFAGTLLPLTVGGRTISPRYKTKILFGVSAQMPDVEPRIWPGFASLDGLGQPTTGL